MSNIKYTLLGRGAGYDYENDGKGQVANLAAGGHFGYAVDIANYLNDQPYVQPPGIMFVLDIPGIYKATFGLVQDPDIWASAFVAIFETKPISIEGFDATLTPQTAEYQLDATKSKFWEIPVGTDVARSIPSITWPADYIGRPIHTVFDHWIRFGMNDPDTRFALLHTYSQDKYKNNTMSATRNTLADMYSMTFIFAKVDKSGMIVDEGFLVRNSFIKKGVDNKASRTLEHGTLEQIQIELTGLVTCNHKTRQLAQLLVDRAMLNGIADARNMPITSDDSDKSLLPESNIPPANPRLGNVSSYQATVDATRAGRNEAPLRNNSDTGP